jgi:hypothetical protein
MRAARGQPPKSHQQTQAEINLRRGGAPMPNDSKQDRPHVPQDVLRNLILLALPWLSFQRDMLEIVRESIQGAGPVRPTEKFALHELHALSMVLDRSRTLRNLIGEDFEKRVEGACKEILPKLASASCQFIESQELILTSAIGVLDKVRKADNESPRSKRRR